MKRHPPEELIQLERLAVRLPTSHHKYAYIQTKYHQLKAGHAGEIYVDRVLQEISYPRGVKVLTDIRLEINPHFQIQIDTLIVSPHSIILLEVKYYAGTVNFNEDSGKTTKIASNGEIDKYDCIIHQLDRATVGLKTWLEKRNISIPVIPILVMANGQTEISVVPDSITLKYAKQLPRYIRRLLAETESLQAYPSTSIAEMIVADQVSWSMTPACQRYEIVPAHLIRGVLCSSCHSPMDRKRGHSWICYACRKKDPGALEVAIKDWFLLIGHTVSNKQLRFFLDLKSSAAASIIFSQSSGMLRLGNAPHTFYTFNKAQVNSVGKSR